MASLVICAFDGPAAAPSVLEALERSHHVPRSLASAAVVSISSDGRYAIGTRDRPGSEIGFCGIFWGALFGLVLHVPATLGSYGPHAGAVFETVRNAGADASFQARARAALEPGTSALGLVVEDDEAQELFGLVAPYGPTVVERTLTPEQYADLARELGQIT